MNGNELIGSGLMFLALFVFFRRGRRIWDPFSPNRLYSALWLFCTGLCQLRLLDDEEPWRAGLWIVVLLGYVGFALGSLIISLMIPVGRKENLNPLLRVREDYSDNIFKWLRWMIVCSGLVLGLQYWLKGGIPAFSEDDQLRATYAINSYVQRIALTVIPVTSVYSILMVHKKQLKLRSYPKHYVTLLLSILIILSMESRFFLLVAFLPVIVVVSYSVRMPDRREFLTRVVPLVLVVIYSRALLRSFSYFELSVESVGAQIALYLGPIYIAVIGHFEGLQRIVDLFSGQLPLRYGLGGSFDVITAFLKGPLRLDYYSFAAFRKFNSFYINQYTHLGLAFADFGYIGVLLIGTIYGVASSWSYRRMLGKPTLLNMYVYGLIALAILLTIVTNILLKLEFVYNSLVVAIVLFLARRPELGVQESRLRAD
jgi:oligosaccharide repeat unit polymerase